MSQPNALVNQGLDLEGLYNKVVDVLLVDVKFWESI